MIPDYAGKCNCGHACSNHAHWEDDCQVPYCDCRKFTRKIPYEKAEVWTKAVDHYRTSFLQKIKCWFGWHVWKFYPRKQVAEFWFIEECMECKHCGKGGGMNIETVKEFNRFRRKHLGGASGASCSSDNYHQGKYRGAAEAFEWLEGKINALEKENQYKEQKIIKLQNAIVFSLEFSPPERLEIRLREVLKETI